MPFFQVEALHVEALLPRGGGVERAAEHAVRGTPVVPVRGGSRGSNSRGRGGPWSAPAARYQRRAWAPRYSARYSPGLAFQGMSPKPTND